MKKEKFDINQGKALIFEDDKGRFTLSPRGCFASAIWDTSISTDANGVFGLSETSKFDSAFTILVKRFKEHGWIEDDDNLPVKGTKEEQEQIFCDTVKGFYPNATNEQVTAAYDLFKDLIVRHGNTKEK